MARRYSGECKIYIEWFAHHQRYKVSVTTPTTRWGGWVDRLLLFEWGVKNSNVIDAVALHGLCCAAEEIDVAAHAERGEDGAWIVKRKRS